MNHIEECPHCGTIAAMPAGLDEHDDYDIYDNDICSCGLERYVAAPESCDCDFCQASETPEAAATATGANNESDQHSLHNEPTALRTAFSKAIFEHLADRAVQPHGDDVFSTSTMTLEQVSIIVEHYDLPMADILEIVHYDIKTGGGN